jgi:transcriptional regulator with XRE-family HTH domain
LQHESLLADQKSFWHSVSMKKRMTLDEWCELDGRGPSALAEYFDISRATLWRLRNGGRKITVDTARKIELATGGKVRAATLLGVEA